MTVLGHFLLYNLLPSLVVGAAVWLLLVVTINLLPIRQAALRLCLLAIPLFKSLLLLLGLGLILPWPEHIFQSWQANALPWQDVIPFLLLSAGVVLLLHEVVVRRVRRRILRRAQPAPERLQKALDEVTAAYHDANSCRCANGLRCHVNSLPRPQLVVSDAVPSPMVVTGGGKQTILFPTGLAGRLDDDELAGALAHEVTHFGLRWPGWCSVAVLRNLTLVTPVAALVSGHVYREEEKACDDMAVQLTGDREAYAGMLLKSYRYALAQENSLEERLAFLPHLLGRRSSFEERVRRLLREPAPDSAMALQTALTALIWVLASVLFFEF